MRRIVTLFHAFLILFPLIQGNAQAQIVPSGCIDQQTGFCRAYRLYNWQGNVGVPGGIPVNRPQFVNVRTTINSRYKCAGDGVADDTACIQNSIDDCPAGQVVYLPQGTYKLSSSIRVYSKSNWTLRGDGPGKTIIIGNGGTTLSIGNSPWGAGWAATTKISAGAVRGSTTITVDSTANIQDQQLMWMEQDNDPALAYGYGVGNSNTPTYNVDDRLHDNAHVVNFRAKVTNITGNQVSFFPPLPFDFNPGLNPAAVGFGSQAGVQFVGIEDLTVRAQGGSYGVLFVGSYGSWVKNAEITGWKGEAAVKIEWSASCEIRDSYIHEPSEYGWSTGYLEQFDDVNNTLVENNVFWKYQAGFVLQGGCVANVIGYNAFIQEYDVYPSGVQFQLGSMYGNHTPYPMLNLWEGNYGNELKLDYYYGPSGSTTALRNFLTGTDPDITQNRIAVSLDSHQWYGNIVGNVLGSTGVHADIQNKLHKALYPDSAAITVSWVNKTPLSWTYDVGERNFGYGENAIFRLGFPYSGNNSFSAVANPPSSAQLDYLDQSVRLKTIIHGNFDFANKAVTWSGGIADRTVPKSYYLSSAPGWFGSLPWPAYEPANGAAADLTSIPAGYRFVNGANPPPSGPAPSAPSGVNVR